MNTQTAPAPPKASPEVLGAIASLQRLAALFLARREALARAAGITVAQWEVLERITDEHFMPSLFAQARESSSTAPTAASAAMRSPRRASAS
jgi:hypothetical protein